MGKLKHRLQNYDYSKANYYFITINTYNKQKFFGKIVDDKMIYNKYGKIFLDEIENIFDNDKATITCYQLMPNHLHLIIELKKDGAIKLNNVISYLKSTITKKVKDIKPLWARGYYDRVIRDEKEYYNVYEYITNNPYMDKYKW